MPAAAAAAAAGVKDVSLKAAAHHRLLELEVAA